jgi:hypothetical protein
LEDQPVPDVSSIAPTDVRLWVALDVHKLSIVAATLPPAGGKPQVCRIETTEKRSAGSSTGSAALTDWRCVTRPAREESRCGGCCARWASRATSSRPSLSRSVLAIASRPTAATPPSPSRCTAADC